MGDFAQGPQGSQGQGWSPSGWDWAGLCPYHPLGLSKDCGLVPGNNETMAGFKDEDEMLRLAFSNDGSGDR